MNKDEAILFRILFCKFKKVEQLMGICYGLGFHKIPVPRNFRESEREWSRRNWDFSGNPENFVGKFKKISRLTGPDDKKHGTGPGSIKAYFC